MNKNIEVLIKEKAEITSSISSSSFNGSVEVKTINNEKYIYVRKRELSKYKSIYIDKYNIDLYTLAIQESLRIRKLKKDLRYIEKELALLGYFENAISARVSLNIDFARANVKSLIYDQAVLEGVSTTFPQTETILENGEINGVKTIDVIKILNLKHAWEFILDKDVLSSPTDFYLLSHIAKLINENIYDNGGKIRSVPVKIGGSTYIPPLPIEQDIKKELNEIINSNINKEDIAINIALYCMKTQIFIDGNKRASIILANHYMIKEGLGLIVVPYEKVEKFKELLVKYYEGSINQEIKDFLKNECIRRF